MFTPAHGQNSSLRQRLAAQPEPHGRRCERIDTGLTSRAC